MYYRNANAALLCFDLTNYKSFLDVKDWVQELHKYILLLLFTKNVNHQLICVLFVFLSILFCYSNVWALYRNVIEPMILTVVGNKIDLERERAVSREEAFLYASSINASYFETSAINGGRGIEQVFISTARGLLQLAENTDCSSLKRYDSADSILSFSELNGEHSRVIPYLKT